MVPSFILTSFCLIVLLLHLHFCLTHFETTKCIGKSLIANSTYFFVETQPKKENLKSVFGCQSLSTQTGIPVSQTLWIMNTMQKFYGEIHLNDVIAFIFFYIPKLVYQSPKHSG